MFIDFLVPLKIANLLHIPRVWRWCELDPIGRNFLLTSNYMVVIFDFWLVITVDLLCLSIQQGKFTTPTYFIIGDHLTQERGHYAHTQQINNFFFIKARHRIGKVGLATWSGLHENTSLLELQASLQNQLESQDRWDLNYSMQMLFLWGQKQKSRVFFRFVMEVMASNAS